MTAWAVPGYTEDRELGRARPPGSSRRPATTPASRWRSSTSRPRLPRDPGFLARFREEVELLALDRRAPRRAAVRLRRGPRRRRGDPDRACRRRLAARDDHPAGRHQPGVRARGAEGLAARPGRRPPARHRAPRLQAGERARRRRGEQQADRLRRRGQGRGAGPRRRHAAVHGTRAGNGEPAHPGDRHLRRHGRVLRVPDRPDPVLRAPRAPGDAAPDRGDSRRPG